MSDYAGAGFDLAAKEYYDAVRQAHKSGTTSQTALKSWRDEDTPSNELSFTDMLQLMVVQFQNQTIDNTADTSDMMNQLVQMSVVQAMTSLTTQMEQVTQATTLTYSASLVGKTVTVGVFDDKGNMKEICDKVTATGTYNGIPVLFFGKDRYPLSSILAVGELPKIDVGDPDKPGEGEDTKPTDPDKPGEGEDTKPTDPDKPGEGEDTKPTDPDKPGEGEDTKPTDPPSTGGTDAPENNSGTEQEPMQI